MGSSFFLSKTKGQFQSDNKINFKVKEDLSNDYQ